MANSNSPITRTSLDSTVVYTLFALMFVLLGVLAFRSFTGQDCSKVGFVVASEGYRAGEVISLKDTTFGASSWEWDFGDKSPVSKIKAPIHVYDNPGKYEIKLLVNGSCEKSLTVIILAKKLVEPMLAGEKLVLPVIKTPKRIYAGEPAFFSADSSNGNTFDWNFGETERTDASGKQVSYTFANPGAKNITVYVNGSANVVTKAVTVVKRAPGEAPAPAAGGGGAGGGGAQMAETQQPAAQAPPIGVKAPLISDDDFTELLNKISKGKTSLNDLLTYSCGKNNITVTVNNAEKFTLADFFNKLKENGKIVVKKARLRTNANNCLLDLEVETKKKLI